MNFMFGSPRRRSIHTSHVLGRRRDWFRGARTGFKTCFCPEAANFVAKNTSEAEEYPRYFEAETQFCSPKLAAAAAE
jgi:hypothetical protein